MSHEYMPDRNFEPWGPFVPSGFTNQVITYTDVTIASVVWGLTLVNVLVAIYVGYGQSTSSRSPLRSVYVWMIWLELVASFIMGLVCFLHLLKLIRPSFYFYMTILFMWCVQVQLLLQIIINRIRIIIPDREHSKTIMIGTAAVVTAINISVFNIWIPARLQISPRFIFVNNIWDRIEKGIYLAIDAALNWYFLRVVKANLINNGLQKYGKLLRFNQRIIALSLLMDVMIIAAMSIPNSFVYVQFHPLAYLVKLNIEMTMANLIKRIAISSSRQMGNLARVREEFGSSNLSTTGNKSSAHNNTARTHHARRSSIIELSASVFATTSRPDRDPDARAVSFAPTGNQIKVTEHIYVRSEPRDTYARDPAAELGVAGADLDIGVVGPGMVKAGGVVVKSKSLDDITEGESVKSEYGHGKGDSDDETALVVGQRREQWDRR